MNKFSKIIITAGIMVMLLIQGCKRPEAPVFEKVRDIVITEKTGNTFTVTALADFYNPNNYKMVLKRADIDVLLEGKKISNLHQEYNLVIDRNSKFTVPLEATISQDEIRGNLINSALSILLGKKLTLNYVGNIRVKAYGVGIRVPIEGESKIDLREL
jgi:LEA14-like dessication related protein